MCSVIERWVISIGAFIGASILPCAIAYAEEAAHAQPEVAQHPAAIDHVPFFVTAPGQTDYLFIAMVIFLLAVILAVGNLYFQLHALPERMSHKANQVQMEIVAVLCLIALFTHNHIYWILGLLLAFIQLPDFSTPIGSIAASLRKLARAAPPHEPEATTAEPPGSAAPVKSAASVKRELSDA